MLGEGGMLEPDVTTTHYILTAQCFWFPVLVYRKSINLPWLLSQSAEQLAHIVVSASQRGRTLSLAELSNWKAGPFGRLRRTVLCFFNRHSPNELRG